MRPSNLFQKHLPSFHEDSDVLFICLGVSSFIPEAVAIFVIQFFYSPFNHTQNAMLINCTNVSPSLYLLHLML